MIKAIIFDFGGVLAKDTSSYIYEALGKEVGLTKEDFKEKTKEVRKNLSKGKITMDEYWSGLKNIFGVIDHKKLEEIWIETFVKHNKLNEETVKLVKELKSKNYRIALLSTTSKLETDHSVGRTIFHLFHPIILSFQVGTKKPEEKIYKITLEKLSVRPDECVFIDNLAVNLPPAEKLGMKTILFESSEQLREELKKLKVL